MQSVESLLAASPIDEPSTQLSVVENMLERLDIILEGLFTGDGSVGVLELKERMAEICQCQDLLKEDFLILIQPLLNALSGAVDLIMKIGI